MVCRLLHNHVEQKVLHVMVRSSCWVLSRSRCRGFPRKICSGLLPFKATNRARPPFQYTPGKIIQSVTDEAQEAGLQVGDELLSINDQQFGGYAGFQETLVKFHQGSFLKVIARRADGNLVPANIRLAAIAQAPYGLEDWLFGIVALLFVPALALVLGFSLVCVPPIPQAGMAHPCTYDELFADLLCARLGRPAAESCNWIPDICISNIQHMVGSVRHLFSRTRALGPKTSVVEVAFHNTGIGHRQLVNGQ